VELLRNSPNAEYDDPNSTTACERRSRGATCARDRLDGCGLIQGHVHESQLLRSLNLAGFAPDARPQPAGGDSAGGGGSVPALPSLYFGASHVFGTCRRCFGLHRDRREHAAVPDTVRICCWGSGFDRGRSGGRRERIVAASGRDLNGGLGGEAISEASRIVAVNRVSRAIRILHLRTLMIHCQDGRDAGIGGKVDSDDPDLRIWLRRPSRHEGRPRRDHSPRSPPRSNPLPPTADANPLSGTGGMLAPDHGWRPKSAPSHDPRSQSDWPSKMEGPVTDPAASPPSLPPAGGRASGRNLRD